MKTMLIFTMNTIFLHFFCGIVAYCFGIQS